MATSSPQQRRSTSTSMRWSPSHVVWALSSITLWRLGIRTAPPTYSVVSMATGPKPFLSVSVSAICYIAVDLLKQYQSEMDCIYLNWCSSSLFIYFSLNMITMVHNIMVIKYQLTTLYIYIKSDEKSLT